MYKPVISFILFLIFFNVSYGQTTETAAFDRTKLDSLFSNLNQHHLGMGNIAISKNNKVIYQNAFGDAVLDPTKKVPSTIKTLYRIGSVTKMFTAVLVFQYIENGLLSLDDPVIKFYLEIPQAKLITVKQLLNHSSGLANYSDAPEFQQWKYKLKPDNELQATLIKSTPDFMPGTRHEYSNTNFFVLSLILEKVSGKLYQQLLEENIVRKINLDKTYYEAAADTMRKGSKSYKYDSGNWIQQREDVAENHLGAGVLVSTPSDLLKFMDALFSYKLIDKSSLQQMTSFDQEYGLGLFKFTFGALTAYGHEGRINEYYTTLIHFPNNGFSVAYCTNGILYPRDDIVNAVVQICHQNTYSLPHFEGIKINEKKLANVLGNYASENMPINVTCKAQNGQLIVETQGENFESIPINNHYFANYFFGYFFEFNPSKNLLLIKEADNVYTLKRK